MSRRLPVGLLACALAAAPAFGADDETYDLRGPAPKKGDVITHEVRSLTKDAVRTVKLGDKAVSDRFSELRVKERELEVLAVEGGEIARLRIKVLKDVTEETRQKGKRTAKQVTPNKLDKQFIYSERVKGEWKNTLEDAKPTKEQKESLADLQPFKIEDVLLPTGKVKVGHEWKIDAAQFQKILGKKVRDLTGGGTGRFVKVEKDGDEPVAVYEINFDITAKMDEDGSPLEMKLAAKQTTKRSLKTGYDLSSKSDGRLALKGKTDIDGEQAEIDFTGTIDETETWKLKGSK